MGKEVSLANIHNYIEGTTRAMQDSLGILPEYIKEQVVIRLMKCEDDCAKQKKCMKCGCKYPQRLYTTESCNKDRHQDIMNKDDWERYKQENGII